MADVLGADDGNPATLAAMHELDAGLRRLVEQTFRARGGRVTRCLAPPPSRVAAAWMFGSPRTAPASSTS